MTLHVSVVKAAETALVHWLASQLPDLAVSNEWPTPGVPFKKGGEVTILRAGGCDETPVLPVQLQKQVDDPYGVMSTFYYRTHFCEQPMQLDVWATSELRRDDIIQRLGDALTAGKALTLSPAFFAAENVWQNQDPAVQSIVLQMAAPWDHLVAAYQFEAPETEDSAGSNKRTEYRATYRGSAFFDRTVTQRGPRLVKVTRTFTITN